MRSRELWLRALSDSGLWHERSGSLHLAYHDGEAAVLREFLAEAPHGGFNCEWRDASQLTAQSRFINPAKLLGGLWSPDEICIDPREVVAALPGWLHQTHGVKFEFNCAVTEYAQPMILAGGREWLAANLYVCSGEDFQTLYPEDFAAGLTLCHYKNFQDCPSLPALRERFAREMPEYVRYGIHVMASQHARGEITIGDSHEYDEAITPFDKEEINALILAYLRTFLQIPQLQIVQRWNGVYAAHPDELCWTSRPAPGATIVASPGGRGMTMSFGIAEKIVAEVLGEA